MNSSKVRDEAQDVAMQDEAEEIKVPTFLDDDIEEADAYRKVECLKMTL